MEIIYIKHGWLEMLLPPICALINGCFIYQLFVHYVRPRQKFIYKLLLFLTFGISSGMTIWMGDHNLILTFPVFTVLAMLCTDGNKFGRLSVIFAFFCMEMSICALLDTYLKSDFCYDYLRFLIFPAAGRIITYTAVFFFLKRKLPEKIIFLPEQLWKLVFWLSLMPLCTLIAMVSLTYGQYFDEIAYIQAMYLGLAILPFIFLTSFAILAAISALAEHEQLERVNQLSEMREAYYQNLRQQENSTRQLRHDMKNHLSTICTLLAGQNTKEAISYLNQLLESSSLESVKRFCENEAANALLQSKAELIVQNGLKFDFKVHLPENISISDIDLCSLVGNALDNAIRAAASAAEQTITLRCRCDKGVFMLKVTNCFDGVIDKTLKTTKKDSERHGFGISGMKEIAARYNGSLETQIDGHTFILAVYLCL